MRVSCLVSTLALTTLVAATLVGGPGVVQGQQLPSPPNGFRPPPPAPIKPYKVVAATPPAPYSDPSFQAFRKQLLGIAAHKDRVALAKLVVAQGFFWIQDKDVADRTKSGFDNLAKAIDLDANDGSGWEVLAGLASDPTGAELPDHKGVICAPADPAIDPRQFEALADQTQTDLSDWGYSTSSGVEVHSAPKPDAPVIDKLGLNLVRVLPDSAPPDNPDQPAFLHVATPSGKTGFVPLDAISPLGGDQICYVQEASGWKITGYFGGPSQ